MFLLPSLHCLLVLSLKTTQCSLLVLMDTAITDINLMSAMLTRPFSKRDTSLLTSSYSLTMMLPTASRTHTRDNFSTNLLEKTLVLMSMLAASSITKVPLLPQLTILLSSPTTRPPLKEETEEPFCLVLMTTFS